MSMSLRDKIWQWVEELDDWQNDLLRRIYKKGELEESDRQEVSNNLKVTLLGREKDELNNPIRLKKEQIQATQGDNEPVKISKLQNVKNVGSVSEGGELVFLPEGLTVIYGENGAGKSSYARILKKACRAIKQDQIIHPNAFEEAVEEGSAEIIIQKDGTEESIERKVNDPPHPDLNSISIYDRECAEAYTEGNVMDIPYMPSSLQALKQMADEQKKIKQEIQSEIESVDRVIKKLLVELDDFPQDDVVYPKITSLSSNTKIQELEDLRGLDEEERELLQELQKAYQASDPGKINKAISDLTSKKEDTEKLIRRLKQIDEKINQRLEKVYPKLIGEIDSLKESQAILQKDFEQDLNGTWNEAWKTLWRAAKNFSVNHAYKEEEFPVLQKNGKPAKCVLCQQSLTEEGVTERYQRFDEFVENDIEQQLSRKRQRRDNYVKELKELKLEGILSGQLINTLNNVDEQIIKKIEEISDGLNSTRKEVIDALEEEEWDTDINTISLTVKDKLIDLVGIYSERIKSLEDLKDPEERSKLKENINQLLAKKELDEKFEIIENVINGKRKCDLLKAASKALNSKSISDEVSKLGQEIAEGIGEQLSDNLSNFGISHFPIQVEGRARSGETKSEMILENEQQLSAKEILSEGEKNALSISYFLAEISHADYEGTLIFDDPVSSLDDTRRDYVANVIARLALQRQVIVFTHDIYFMTKLERYISALEGNIECLWVWGTSEVSGHVENELPFRRQSPKKMLRRPKGKLQYLKDAEFRLNPEEKRELVSRFYKYLRMTWEAAIEKVFLASIIQRYDYRVNVGGVARLEISDGMKQSVDDGWSNSSEFLHYEGDLASKPLPSVNQMESDLEALSQFIDNYQRD